MWSGPLMLIIPMNTRNTWSGSSQIEESTIPSDKGAHEFMETGVSDRGIRRPHGVPKRGAPSPVRRLSYLRRSVLATAL